MDNAKYQVCKVVTEKAAALNIELVFLPSYSPNLNLIDQIKENFDKRMDKTDAKID